MWIKTNKKGLIVAVILLFISMSVVPSIESAKPEEYTKGENSLFNYPMVLNQDPTCYPVFNGTHGDNGIFITPVNVSFIFDPEIVAEIYYQVGSGEWRVYTEHFVIYEQGCVVFYWYCVDFDGNESDTASYILIIDYSPPELALITPEKGGFYLFGKKLFKTENAKTTILGTIVIDVGAFDECSGIDNVSFSLVRNSEFPETYIAESPPYIWEMTSIHVGEYVLTVTAYDHGGLSVNTTLNMIILQFGIL